MQLRSLTLGPGTIYYLELGKGPDLLFMHGAVATAEAYLPLLDLLGHNYHIVAPIHPDHGRSFSKPSSWGVAEYADFYDDFLHEINFFPDILIGHSFGGTLAMLIAIRSIGKKLIIMDSPCLPLVIKPAELIKSLLIESQASINKVNYLSKLPLYAKASKAILETIITHGRDLPLVFTELAKLDITQVLSQIRIPTQIFWGECDEIIPIDIYWQMLSLIPQAVGKIFPHLGHNYPVTDPDFTYQELIKVLKS